MGLIFFLVCGGLAILAATINAYRNGFPLGNNFLALLITLFTFGLVQFLIIRYPESTKTKYILMLTMNFFQWSLILATHGANKEVYLTVYIPVIMSGFFYQPNFVIITTIVSLAFSTVLHLSYPFLLAQEYITNILTIRIMVLVFATTAVWVICRHSRELLLNLDRETENATNRNRQISDLLTRIAKTGTTLYNGGAKAAAASKEALNSIDQMVTALNQVNTGAQQQLIQAGNVQGELGKITQQIKMVRDILEQVSGIARDSVKRSEEGRQVITGLNDTFDKVSNLVHTVDTLVQNLDKSTTQIDDFVKAIGQITEETNILAVNASIEAARAGEYGRGFSVVAGNVKKLTLNSQKAAENIGELARMIGSDTRNVMKTAQAGVEEVAESINSLQRADNIFADIAEDVKKTDLVLNEMTRAVASLEMVRREIEEAMNVLTTVSRDTGQHLVQINDAMERYRNDFAAIDGDVKTMINDINLLQQNSRQVMGES